MVLAYLLALIPAVAIALTQPVWSRVDEAQHVDFIIQLGHGVYPIADRTLIDHETLRVMKSTGVFRFDYPGTYPLPDLSDIGPPPPKMSTRANAIWMSRHMWQLSYESQQPPGYYLAVLPVWAAADRLGGTMSAIYVLRLINALFSALLTPMALMIVRRLAPGRVEIAVISAVFAGVVPGVILDDTRVSNDALAAAMAGLTIAMTVSWIGEKWTWRRAMVLGLTVGAGVLVKVTLVALGPVVAVAILWPATGSALKHRLMRGAGGAVISAVFVLIWFAINLHLYGAAVPAARTNRLIEGIPLMFTPKLILAALGFFGFTYWTGEPLATSAVAVPVAVLGALIVVIAAAGVIRYWVGEVGPASRPAVVDGVLALGCMTAMALLVPAIGEFKFLGPGRYAYPAVPPAAALMGVGLHVAIKSPAARRILTAAYGVLAAALIVVFALPSAGPMSAGRLPPVASPSMSAEQTARLGGFAVTVDKVALDAAERATWFHVTVRNSGTGEVEWTPTPIATSGVASASGDYSKSTQMPGDIDAGHTSSGWVFVGLDPALLDRGHPIELRFPDVAVDDYTSVGDVVIMLNVDSLLTQLSMLTSNASR